MTFYYHIPHFSVLAIKHMISPQEIYISVSPNPAKGQSIWGKHQCLLLPILHLPSHLPSNTMLLATRHAIYSAAVSTEETATFMLLPSWNKDMTTNPYASLCRKYPHMCKFLLGTIPSDQLQYAKVPFWNNIQIPLSKHSWGLQIIAIWNTKGRVCLNAHNKDWLKELAKEIHEGKWEI